MPTGTVEAADSLPVDCDTDGLKERYGFDTHAARAECLRLALRVPRKVINSNKIDRSITEQHSSQCNILKALEAT